MGLFVLLTGPRGGFLYRVQAEYTGAVAVSVAW